MAFETSCLYNVVCVPLRPREMTFYLLVLCYKTEEIVE